MEENSVKGDSQRSTSRGDSTWLHAAEDTNSDGLEAQKDMGTAARAVLFAVLLLLLGIAALADYFLISDMIKKLLYAESSQGFFTAATFIALAVTILATAGMFMAGHAVKTHQIARLDPHRGFLGLPVPTLWVVVAWVILGTALTVVRWWFATYSSSGLQGQAFGAAATTDASPIGTEHMAALLLGALYFGTGVFAFADGYLLADPLGSRRRRANRELSQLHKKLSETEPKVTESAANLERLAHNTTMAMNDVDRVEAKLQDQLSALDHLLDTLKEYARELVAQEVGTMEAADAVAARPRRGSTTS